MLIVVGNEATRACGTDKLYSGLKAEIEEGGRGGSSCLNLIWGTCEWWRSVGDRVNWWVELFKREEAECGSLGGETFMVVRWTLFI